MTTRPLKALLLLALALVMVLGGISSANAYPPSTSGNTGGNTGGTPPNSGGGTPGTGSSGGGSGGGGGGSTTGVWSNTYVIKGNPASKKLKAPSPAAAGEKSVTVKCSGKNQWGKYVGMLAQHSGITIIPGEASEGTKTAYNYQQATSKICLSPAKFTDSTRECGYSVGGTGTGPRDNPKVASSSKSFPVKFTKFKTGGMKSVPECSKSLIQNFSWNTKAFGRYQLAATGQAVFCEVRDYYEADYFGNLPKDYIKSCGSPHNYSHNQVRWAVFCGGWEMGWDGNYTFTEQDCGDGKSVEEPYKWTCGLSDSNYPYISKVRNNKAIDVFHDAKTRLIEWPKQPKISGKVKSITNKKAQIRYKSGTPFREGLSVNDPTQNFLTSPQMSTYVSGWQVKGAKNKTGFNAQFFKAGMPGTTNNLKLFPRWYFEAMFAVKSLTVTGVNWGTGELSTTTKTVYKKEAATCDGVATNLSIVRSRLSN